LPNPEYLSCKYAIFYALLMEKIVAVTAGFSPKPFPNQHLRPQNLWADFPVDAVTNSVTSYTGATCID
jgi:hypothetical protein